MKRFSCGFIKTDVKQIIFVIPNIPYYNITLEKMILLCHIFFIKHFVDSTPAGMIAKRRGRPPGLFYSTPAMMTANKAWAANGTPRQPRPNHKTTTGQAARTQFVYSTPAGMTAKRLDRPSFFFLQRSHRDGCKEA